MTSQRVSPDGLYDSVRYGFSHGALQQGERTLHLAVRVGWNKAYEVAADDLAAQTRQALTNLNLLLREVGGKPSDIVRLRTFIVDHSLDKLGIILPEIGRLFRRGGFFAEHRYWRGRSGTARTPHRNRSRRGLE